MESRTKEVPFLINKSWLFLVLSLNSVSSPSHVEQLYLIRKLYTGKQIVYYYYDLG